MANWLLDYIEMTEYIPSELREQLTSIRELDLQVHNAMDELERDIRQFFSNIDTLTQKERQEQYEALLKKCDVATRAASDKVKVADKLHDLVEKSMRLLDQGLEKLKEELLEGDKAYIVEDLERRSLEMDEQTRLEHESISQRQTSKSQTLKAQSTGSNNTNHSNHNRLSSNDSTSSKSNLSNSQSNHRHSMPAQSTNININNNNNNNNSTNTNKNLHHHLNTNHRSRNNSTGTQNNSVGPQKKRERKRLNSAMTIFNRNSRIDDDDSTTNQSFISSPMTPDYLVSMQNSNKSLSDVVAGANNCSLTLKGMVTGNRITIGTNDKSNGKDPLAGAKQPILTAIDAAHAVSPNATNSDKLVLFSNNANGDNNDATLHYNIDKQQVQNNSRPLSANQLKPTSIQQLQNHNQLSNHLLAPVGFNSGDSTLINNSIIATNSEAERPHSHHHSESSNHKTSSVLPFSSLPLSSRHDPIMMAASQAISATQNMTPGRRTSSLKASYAAVNSGRLQSSAPPTNHQLFEQGGGLVHEVYCKCRSHIQGSNMIACDNSRCKIEWFHYECVGITTPPEGEWYCDECRISLGVHNHKSNKQPKLEGVNVT